MNLVADDLEPVWRHVPPDVSPAYHRVFYRVAGVLQTVLRAHVDRVWNAAAHERDVTLTTSVLAWISADPARQMDISDFTYDVLNGPLMRSFYWCVRRRLPRRLEQIRADLTARGQHDLARVYRPTRIASIVVALKKNRRIVNRLIGAEHRLMNDVLLYASDMSGHRGPRRGALSRLSRRWARTLKHTLAGYDFSEVGPLLFTSLTRELERALADLESPAPEMEWGTEVPHCRVVRNRPCVCD